LNRENKLFGIIPRVQFADKSTYTESHTKEYDMVIFIFCCSCLWTVWNVWNLY